MAHPAQELTHDPLVGQLVADRYELGSMLGRGGFGAVYEGHDTAEGRAVAVKVFSRSAGLAQRARREARTASKLEHPNIHAVIGVEEDEDNAYLVSELVVGHRFDRTELSDEEAVRAIAAVADALAHAHGRRVVHRDVKPANILISTEGDVCLTDFGIARDEDARDPAVDKRVLGTLSYMAPEQARGQSATGAADVWAASLTLYSRLTGSNPYKAKTLAELHEKLAAGAPPLHQARPDLPRALSRVLARGLDNDPARRPDAAGFRDALLDAIADQPSEHEQPMQPDRPRARARRAPALPAFDPVRLRRPVQIGSALLAAAVLAWTLVAFPMYPPSWTLPLAAVVALAALRRPAVGAAIGAALLVPAFWNHAEAAGLTWIALSGAWIYATRHWPPGRMFSPLLAVPLGLIGLGPAYVLAAATAATPRRRAAEGAAGGVVLLVAGPLVPARAVTDVAGAQSPAALVGVLDRAPQAAVTVAAMAAFAVLLPIAWERLDVRRVQAVVLWGLGFGLLVAGAPQVVGAHPQAWVPAAFAAAVAAIIPAALAVASPRLRMLR